MKLTRRGQMLLVWLVVAVVIALFLIVNNALTPDRCKGPLNTLDQGCIELLYPH